MENVIQIKSAIKKCVDKCKNPMKRVWKTLGLES